jgi:RND family efflux transporter MFP subunit
MMDRLKSRWVAGGAALLVLMSAACVRMAPMAWQRLSGPTDEQLVAQSQSPDDGSGQAGAVVPLPGGPGITVPGLPGIGATGRQAVAVRKGSITEMVQINGRVAGQEEMPLSVTAPGRVQAVNVRPGVAVKEGDVLLELDARSINRDLAAARARLEAETVRLRQAQNSLQARQNETNRQRSLSQTGGQRAVADAEAAVLRAQTELDKVRAGASQADREAAEGAVQAARAQVERTEAEVARLSSGPNGPEVQAAEQQLITARVGLQKAESDLAKAKAGTTGLEQRMAERELVASQAEFDVAQAELQRLQAGPDPALVSRAERDLDRARILLQLAEAMRPDPNNPGARDASIANARVGIREAEEALARAKQPAKAFELDIARRKLESARLAVENAKERLALTQQAPDQLTVDTAQATVDAARITVQMAEQRLQTLQAGAPADQVQVAQNAVAAAKNALSVAEARQRELLSHPTEVELREAERRHQAAQATLERARTEAQPLPEVADSATFDVQLLEQSVATARAQVETIERELTATKLRAPFAGTVVTVSVRSGDPIEPGQPAIVLTKPGDAVLRADLSDKDAQRIAAGQEATVLPEGKDAQPLPATVAAVGPAESGVGLSATLQLLLPEGAPRPNFGTAAQISVKVSTKDNVLLVPEKAVRTAGTRRYVEYMDGSNRRIADVQVGIASGGEVEVVSGLQEGQTVLVQNA